MSSDAQQYAPLTQSMVRSLTDKLYEKRKAAALEIERRVLEVLFYQLFKILGKYENWLKTTILRNWIK